MASQSQTMPCASSLDQNEPSASGNQTPPNVKPGGRPTLGSYCMKVGLTKEIVRKIIQLEADPAEGEFVRGEAHPLAECTRGVAYDLWSYFKQHPILKTKTADFRANLVGRVFSEYFRDGEGELLTDGQLSRKLEENFKRLKSYSRGKAENLKKQFEFLKPVSPVGVERKEGRGEELGMAQRLKVLEKKNHRLEQNLVTRDCRIRELERQLESMNEERQYAMELAAGSFQGKKEKEERLGTLKETVGTLKKKVRSQQTNIIHKKRLMQERKQQLKERTQELTQAHTQLALLKQQRTSLTRKVRYTKAAQIKGKNVQVQLELTNLKLRAEIGRLHSQICSLQTQLHIEQKAHIQTKEIYPQKLERALQCSREQLKEKKKIASATAKYHRKRASDLSEAVKRQQKRLKSGREVVKSLRETLKVVENEKAELEEEMEGKVQERLEKFMQSREVVTFQKGRYVDEVRALYQDLLGLNVATSKCESVIRAVLDKLGADMRVGRLPQKSFANYMIMEGRALAQRQVVDAVLGSSGVTVCRDGTTKWGHKYGTVDVVLEDGTSLTLGMRDMVGGGAQETLDSLKEMIRDVTELSDRGAPGFNQFVANIKNTMSDRHSAEKKCNELLKDFRDSVLPGVVKNWNGMSDCEKEGVSRMNNFFCGLHFIVGLAKQASEVLKVFEKSEFGERHVGSAALPDVFVQGAEAGTVKLVRLVCMSVQDKADEKSGKPLDFRAFLSDIGCEKQVGLAPFRGNRFNILFRNGGEVYYLFPELSSFSKQMSCENDLMKVVSYDLSVPEYKAGVRALGLVNKCITGPLWRVLNGHGKTEMVHIISMNDKYQQFYDAVKTWSKDASPLLRGECLFAQGSDGVDQVFECLLVDDESNEVFKKILEVMCGAFVKVAERMLADHLEGGKFRGLSKGHLEEMKSVPTTNVNAERDFGMLDRLAREKPNATTLALEGMIMWRQNATGLWRDRLSANVREEYMRIARESRREAMRVFYERHKAIQDMRRLKWVQKRDTAERELRERERSEALIEELVSVGGLWKSECEVDENLSGMSERERVNALKCQLRYRKWKKDKNTNGILNLSADGKAKSCEELLRSLKEFLRQQTPLLPQREAGISGHQGTESQARSGKQMRETMQGQAGYSHSAEAPPHTHKTSVINVDDLLGRVVSHCLKVGEGSKWFMGVVTKKAKGNIYIRYEEEYYFEPGEIVDDYRCGELYVVASIPDMNITGRDVSHMWLDEDTDDEVWWKGRVLSLKNDEVVIEYDDMYDEDDETCADERVTFSCEELQEMYDKYVIRFL